MFDITHPFDCDLCVFLSSNAAIADDKKYMKKRNTRGSQTLNFTVKLQTKTEFLFWNIHFLHHDIASRKFNILRGDFHEITHDCATCSENKEELRESFYKEMTKLVVFRGHGLINFASWDKYREVIPLHERTSSLKPFTEDDIMTLMKLIHFGVDSFNLTISSSTQLEVEYEGIQLKTSIVEELGYILSLY